MLPICDLDVSASFHVLCSNLLVTICWAGSLQVDVSLCLTTACKLGPTLHVFLPR